MTTSKIQIGLRLPDGLRQKVMVAAKSRDVSVNKELTDRIEKSFDEYPSMITSVEMRDRIAQAKRAMTQLASAIEATAKRKKHK